MAKIKETKWVRLIGDSSIDAPFPIPMEAVLILWAKKDLLAIYINLMFLTRVRCNFVLRQPDLAKVLGFSYIFYLKKRKELADLGLIKVSVQNNNFTDIEICSERLWGLYKLYRGVFIFPKDPIVFKTLDDMLNYIDSTGKNMVAKLKEYDKESGKMSVFDNIYNIYNNNTSNNINNNTNNNIKITYPKEDYEMVLNAFKKYKGVGLRGPEITYHMRAIKMMFQAERSPKEIIAFMKWLHDNEKNEDKRWVRSWTIWTVQKKIAEFIGGKLDDSSEEDLERI